MKKKSKEMKPSGKYPALYYQEANEPGLDRIRIIYPSGNAEYRDCIHPILSESGVAVFETPCWLQHNQGSMEFHSSISLMHDYDEYRGFPPAIFLGEIK